MPGGFPARGSPGGREEGKGGDGKEAGTIGREEGVGGKREGILRTKKTKMSSLHEVVDGVKAHAEEGRGATAFRHVAVFAREALERKAVEEGPMAAFGMEAPWMEAVFERIAVGRAMEAVAGIVDAVEAVIVAGGGKPSRDVSVRRNEDGAMVVVVVVGSL